jgi:hypothetical protein
VKKKILPPKTAIVLIQNLASCTPSGPPHSIGNISLRVHVSGQCSSSFESHTIQLIEFETRRKTSTINSFQIFLTINNNRKNEYQTNEILHNYIYKSSF